MTHSRPADSRSAIAMVVIKRLALSNVLLILFRRSIGPIPDHLRAMVRRHRVNPARPNLVGHFSPERRAASDP
jgi:hypothetical protein